MTISDLPGTKQLDVGEQHLCAKWHIDPLLYLQLKRQMVAECRSKGYATPLEVRARGELGMWPHFINRSVYDESDLTTSNAVFEFFREQRWVALEPLGPGEPPLINPFES